MAPQANDSTTYHLSFELAPGDQDIVNNHIPLDPPPANIVLSKSANKQDVVIGDIVQYTLEATNDSSLFAVNAAQVIDNLPPGFAYVAGSATSVEAGPDGILNTGDDVNTPLTAVGTNQVTFSTLNFATNETILVRYLVSVSTGVSTDGGDYVNTAIITDSVGTALSNMATATVRVITDPLLEQTTIIGKVFHDRDGDGFQDNADATGLRIISEHFGEAGAALENLAGLTQLNNEVAQHTVVRMPFNSAGDNSFSITSSEGTVINVGNDGNVSYNHVGKMRAGMTGQSLSVEVVRDADALAITVTNNGVQEQGIPGVRLATVEGLLIETDQFGRYHIAGVDTGNFSLGTNYIVKVDDATLPEGSSFTTENPRVQRLTQSLMTRFNFGVRLPEMAVPTAPVRAPTAQAVAATETTELVTRTLDNAIDPVRFAITRNSGKIC